MTDLANPTPKETTFSLPKKRTFEGLLTQSFILAIISFVTNYLGYSALPLIAVDMAIASFFIYFMLKQGFYD